VQILAVVANIQMRTLKTEVENGSMPTVIGHGLVGPKEKRNCEKSPARGFGFGKSGFFSERESG